VSQLLAVRVSDGSADMRAVVLSFRQSDDRATSRPSASRTNVGSKRGSDLRSQHGCYIAVAQLLAVRVSDGSADMREFVLSFRKYDDRAVQTTQRATDACTQRVTHQRRL